MIYKLYRCDMRYSTKKKCHMPGKLELIAKDTDIHNLVLKATLQADTKLYWTAGANNARILWGMRIVPGMPCFAISTHKEKPHGQNAT